MNDTDEIELQPKAMVTIQGASFYNHLLNTNEKYKTIRYLHGYKTSDHKNNITSWTDRLGGIYSRIQHTLSITTY